VSLVVKTIAAERSLFGMDSQDTLPDTWSVKRQRRPPAKFDSDTGPALSLKASASGEKQHRRTLFFPIKQDEMVEKCKGVPEWRVSAPVSGVHAYGSGIVYVSFSSLGAALNYAKVIRNPPPSKPPRVDGRTNCKRHSSKKRSAARRDDESDYRLLYTSDEVMRAVVDENVEDAFSRALGDDMSGETSVGSERAEPRLECDEELLPNAATSRFRSSSVLLEPHTPLSVRTVQHVSRESRSGANVLSTTLFGTPMKQSSFPFVLPESKDKRLLSTPKRRGWPSGKGEDRHVETTPKQGARASLYRFAPIALDDVRESTVGAATIGENVSDLF